VAFDLKGTLASYDARGLTLCSIGSHSALEVAAGARAQGLRNLIITERGRNTTYDAYYARRTDGPPRGCVDATLELTAFADVLDATVQVRLRRENVVFVPNRSFEVYLHQRYSYAEIEERMAAFIMAELKLDAAGAPALSVFGGKLTTYRRLAEQALARLAPHLDMGPPWTHAAVLPSDDFAAPAAGEFGPGLGKAEVEWLMREEWARTADDILWRRSKLGLAVSPEQAAALARFVAGARSVSGVA